MTQYDVQQFFNLYQQYRYDDQRIFYIKRRKEFKKAYTQAIWTSILLMFLTALAGAIGSVNNSWLQLTCLLLATILPIFSTAITAYNTLYGFEQQAKLYQDTINALLAARVFAPNLKPGLSEAEFSQYLDKYIHEVEKAFSAEQGQWGQLAKTMKPS